MTYRYPPGTVVARLRQPFPVTPGLTQITKGLERQYGGPLVVVAADPLEPDWWIVAIPAEPEATP